MGKIEREEDVEELLQAFAAALEAQGRRPRTVVGYRNDIVTFASWLKAQKTIGSLMDVQTQDVSAYRRHLQQEQGRAACTVNRRLSGLRVFYDWAVGQGYLVTNPATGVRGVSVRSSPVRWLTRGEQMRLITVVEETLIVLRPEGGGKRKSTENPTIDSALPRMLRDRAIIYTLLNTGLRVAELVHLRVGQVTLEAGQGQVWVATGKGGSSRVVALNGLVRQVLADYLALRGGAPEDALFPGKHGRMGVRQVPRILKLYVKLAGLDADAVTVHTLRHTFARNLVEAGASPTDVAALLGFARTASVSRYIDESSGDLRPAVERVGEIFQAPAATGAIESPFQRSTGNVDRPMYGVERS